MPGVIDPRIHFPQVQVIASWAKQSLDWLNGYVFPGETRFADPAYAARMAEMILHLLLATGRRRPAPSPPSIREASMRFSPPPRRAASG
jgi:cytosine/adenosine deaminase-related metal-dependent hydrolase